VTLATVDDLVAALEDARSRTHALVDDLGDDELEVPRIGIVNPILWEIGHVAWFQEKWCLRREGGPSVLREADALYDSAAVAHDTRWDIVLPSRAETWRYAREVLDAVCERLAGRTLEPETRSFVLLSLFHEDMHGEAFLYTRQTLSLLPPRGFASSPASGGTLPGDAEISGGTFRLGAEESASGGAFVFDNEKWAHDVTLAPFRIARAAVTEDEFAAFADDRGYSRRELWTDEGWRWRESARAERPVYWSRGTGGRWFRRDFDRLVPIDSALPVVHVCAHEADAFCRWAGRRLPTEAEWEAAAAGDDPRAIPRRKRPHPWGDGPPGPDRARLDLDSLARADVGAFPAGDSACGCRQMTGNVWEWTSSAFGPYPGFTPDPYKEYSAPWFGDHRVLRGGCFATRGRLLRNTWRNFYRPDRRDVFAGFRTAADAE